MFKKKKTFNKRTGKKVKVIISPSFYIKKTFLDIKINNLVKIFHGAAWLLLSPRRKKVVGSNLSVTRSLLLTSFPLGTPVSLLSLPS